MRSALRACRGSGDTTIISFAACIVHRLVCRNAVSISWHGEVQLQGVSSYLYAVVGCAQTLTEWLIKICIILAVGKQVCIVCNFPVWCFGPGPFCAFRTDHYDIGVFGCRPYCSLLYRQGYSHSQQIVCTAYNTSIAATMTRAN